MGFSAREFSGGLLEGFEEIGGGGFIAAELPARGVARLGVQVRGGNRRRHEEAAGKVGFHVLPQRVPFRRRDALPFDG